MRPAFSWNPHAVRRRAPRAMLSTPRPAHKFRLPTRPSAHPIRCERCRTCLRISSICTHPPWNATETPNPPPTRRLASLGFDPADCPLPQLPVFAPLCTQPHAPFPLCGQQRSSPTGFSFRSRPHPLCTPPAHPVPSCRPFSSSPGAPAAHLPFSCFPRLFHRVARGAGHLPPSLD